MNTMARTETAEQRSRIFSAMRVRNRLVSVLRLAVPVLGVLIIAALVLQAAIAGLAPGFGFSSISIDRNMLVVEAPTYSGMSADGTGYAVTATAARSPIGRTDLIDLSDAMLTQRRPDGAVMTAEAGEARLETGPQIVRVVGTARVGGSDGMQGTLDDVTADMANETLVAEGAVDISFANGATLQAAGLSYDGKRATWLFGRTTLTLPAAPGAVEPGTEVAP